MSSGGFGLGDSVAYVGHSHIGANVYEIVCVHGDGRYDIRLANGLEAGADPEQQRVDGVSAGELELVKRRGA